VKKWRKLHNEELYDLYCSPNIIQTIKSRMTKWVGHIACIGGTKVHIGFGVEACKQKITWKTYTLMESSD
jgi:hypothetical protein